MNHPIYHLRPHKAVDRNLFCEVLRHLSKIIDISNYRYIGFGSYEFDEFKLAHRYLGITDMHSIESETDIYNRQKFNRPYPFIELFNEKCEQYIDEDFDPETNSIFWMDFSDATDKAGQFSDVTNLFAKLSEKDIVRVTLNANASSIKTSNVDNMEYQLEQDDKKILRTKRFVALKNSLNTIFPADAIEDDVTAQKYPALLLKILYNAAYAGLGTDLSICPLCIYTYEDGQRMITITMIVVPCNEKEKIISTIKTAFADWSDFVKIDSWTEIIKIVLPGLTIHEQLELIQRNRNREEIKKTSKDIGLPEEAITQFYKFYRYYPNYQPVVI